MSCELVMLYLGKLAAELKRDLGRLLIRAAAR